MSNRNISALGIGVAVGFWVLSCVPGCVPTTCEKLQERAKLCGTAAGTHVDRERSTCENLRQELGMNRFDDYAQCFLDSACDDVDAIARCREQHIGPSTDACDDLRLWAASCGLQPRAAEQTCSQGGVEPEFQPWVACVTQQGCPTTSDSRYDTCNDYVVSAEARRLLNTCLELRAWGDQCGDQVSPVVIGAKASLVECMTVATLSPADGFPEYGRCISQCSCDDVVGHLLCLRFLVDQQESDRG